METRKEADIFQAIRNKDTYKLQEALSTDACALITTEQSFSLKPIALAAYLGFLEGVRVIANFVKPSIDNDLGFGDALYFATIAGEEDIVKLLLKQGALTNKHDPLNLENVLHKAIRIKNKRLIEIFLQAKVSLTHENTDNQTPIMLAAELAEQDPDYFELIKLIASSLNKENNKNDEAKLGYALSVVMKTKQNTDKESLVRTLINSGADVNYADKEGNTPLHLAVMSNDINMLSLLLRFDADIERRNNEYKMATHYAFDQQLWPCLESISKKRGLNYNLTSSPSWFINAIKAQQYAIVDLLTKTDSLKKDNINLVDDQHNSALHHAVLIKDNKMIDLLLERGIDTTLKNDQGLTALDLACQANFGNNALKIIHHVKNIKDDVLALRYAVRHQNQAVVQELLEKGVNVDIYDCELGNPAIYDALQSDNADILSLLLQKIALAKVKKTQDGKTPIDLAYALGAVKCAALINAKLSDNVTITSFDWREARDKFLKNLQEEIKTTTWWVKKPSAQLWHSEGEKEEEGVIWVKGRPTTMDELYKLASIGNFDQLFRKVTSIRPKPVTERHRSTDAAYTRWQLEALKIVEKFCQQQTLLLTTGNDEQPNASMTTTVSTALPYATMRSTPFSTQPAYTYYTVATLPVGNTQQPLEYYLLQSLPVGDYTTSTSMSNNPLGYVSVLPDVAPLPYSAPAVTYAPSIYPPLSGDLTNSMFPAVPTHTINIANVVDQNPSLAATLPDIAFPTVPNHPIMIPQIVFTDGLHTPGVGLYSHPNVAANATGYAPTRQIDGFRQ